MLMEATISAMLEACESPLALKFLFRRGGVPAIRNSLSALASPDKPGNSESGRLSAQSKVPVCSKRLPKLSRTTIAGFKTSLISSFVTGVLPVHKFKLLRSLSEAFSATRFHPRTLVILCQVKTAPRARFVLILLLPRPPLLVPARPLWAPGPSLLVPDPFSPAACL